MTTVEKIRANAEMVVRKSRELVGPEFGYDRESVLWLHGYIERQRARPDVDQAQVEGLVNVMGSFLGECIVAATGAEWREHPAGLAVAIDDGTMAFPFTKVRKQFESGAGESVAGFYDTILGVFRDVREKRRLLRPEPSDS